MTLSRQLLAAVAIGLLVSLIAELMFVEHRHRLFLGSDLTLYWAGFGFLACVTIVIVSKWVGHAFLMKHDDPYTGEHVEAEPGEHDRG